MKELLRGKELNTITGVRAPRYCHEITPFSKLSYLFEYSTIGLRQIDETATRTAARAGYRSGGDASHLVNGGGRSSDRTLQ